MPVNRERLVWRRKHECWWVHSSKRWNCGIDETVANEIFDEKVQRVDVQFQEKTFNLSCCIDLMSGPCVCSRCYNPDGWNLGPGILQTKFLEQLYFDLRRTKVQFSNWWTLSGGPTVFPDFWIMKVASISEGRRIIANVDGDSSLIGHREWNIYVVDGSANIEYWHIVSEITADWGVVSRIECLEECTISDLMETGTFLRWSLEPESSRLRLSTQPRTVPWFLTDAPNNIHAESAWTV